MRKKIRKDFVVANVEETQAIDFTIIYKITPIKTIRPNTPLRFDTGTKVITTDFPTENNLAN